MTRALEGRLLRPVVLPLLVACFVLLTGAPHRAWAVSSVQGVGGLAVGYDSNIEAQPNYVPGGRIADEQGILTLGVLFTSALARAQQQLSYDFYGQLYFHHIDDSTYANRLTWRGVFDTSRTTMLRLNVAVTQARVNSLLAGASSGSTVPTLTNNNNDQAITAVAGASLLWDIRARTRLIASAGFDALISLGQTETNSYLVTTAVDFEQLWRRDAFGLQLGVDETIFGDTHGAVTRADGTTDRNGVLSPGYQLLLLRALVSWRRDLNAFWSVHLAAGVVGGLRPDDGGSGTIVQPAGEASLRYFDKYLGAELQYRHDVAPNVLVAQAFLIDSATLRINAPLGQTTHLTAGASAGYQYNQGLLSDGTLSGSAQVALADATLGYSPRAGIALYARYQFAKQLDVHPGIAYSAPPFVRHFATVGVTFAYPPTSAVPAPSRVGSRVDGSDGTSAPPVHSPVAEDAH